MVEKLGDLLVEHWSGSSGEEMKKHLGAFCSRNKEINDTYRDLLKNDKKFANFVKVCDFLDFFIINMYDLKIFLKQVNKVFSSVVLV